MRVVTRYQLLLSGKNEKRARDMLDEFNKKGILTFCEIGKMDIIIETNEFVEDGAICHRDSDKAESDSCPNCGVEKEVTE